MDGCISNEKAFTRADLSVLLVDFNFELSPSGVVVAFIEVISGKVVGRRIVSGAFETRCQIVGVVKSLAAGHVREFSESFDGRLLQPRAIGELLHSRWSGTHARRR